MRVHPITGQFAHGVAGGGTFVDGHPLDTEGQSGYACWLRDRVAYQWCDQQVKSLPAGGGTARVEADEGVSWLAAGGALWVGHQSPTRTRPVQALTSWGHRLPGAGALGVALDGSAVFVVVDFQQDRGLARYRPDATAPDLVLADIRGPLLLSPYAQFSALDADRFLWRTIDGSLHTHGLPEPVRQPWPSFQPSLIDCGVEGVWVADGDGGDRLRVRPLDSLMGYVVREKGSPVQARGFSIVGRCRDGVLTLGWSADTSEGAAAFRTVTIPLSSPRILLTATPVLAPPVEVPPVPPVVPPAPVQSPLTVAIDDYTRGGEAPVTVRADFRVEGHGNKPLQVYLTLDGQRVAVEFLPAGSLETVITEPGEYRLGAVVECAGRRAETGAVRIVRVTPKPDPIQTGKAGYVQAGEIARQELGRTEEGDR